MKIQELGLRRLLTGDFLFVGIESLGIEGVFLSLMGMNIHLSFIVSSLKITEWYTTGREGTMDCLLH